MFYPSSCFRSFPRENDYIYNFQHFKRKCTRLEVTKFMHSNIIYIIIFFFCIFFFASFFLEGVFILRFFGNLFRSQYLRKKMRAPSVYLVSFCFYDFLKLTNDNTRKLTVRRSRKRCRRLLVAGSEL